MNVDGLKYVLLPGERCLDSRLLEGVPCVASFR